MVKTRKQSKREGKENNSPNSLQEFPDPTLIERKKRNKGAGTSQFLQSSNLHTLQPSSILTKPKKDKLQKQTTTFTCTPMRIVIKRLSIDELKEMTSVKPVKEYNLRRRKPVFEKKETVDKISKVENDKQIIKKDKAVPINTLFDNCKKNKTDIVENRIVLAKMATYSPWPAKVIQIISEKRVKVFFFRNKRTRFRTFERLCESRGMWSSYP